MVARQRGAAAAAIARSAELSARLSAAVQLQEELSSRADALLSLLEASGARGRALSRAEARSVLGL